MDKTGFAAAVKAARGEMSQKVFAKKVGVSQVTVSEWESGKKVAGRDRIAKLAEVSGKPLRFFYGTAK